MAARRLTSMVAALALLLFLPACSWWSGVSYPIPPTSGGSDETPIAFEHFVQVSWASTDLALLESMEIQYPAEVAIVPSADNDELQVEIHFDVEKPNNDSYSQAFLQQIQSASNLDSQNAQVHIPLPQHPCQETVNAQGQVSSLQGVCVRELVISLPASHPIPITVAPGGDFNANGITVSSLHLTLPSQGTTHSDIEGISGDLTISGGGTGSNLVVDQLGNTAQKTGSLTMLLSTIQSAELSRIGGAVSISIAHPPTQPGAVTLDGTQITSFPYTRP